MTTQFANHFHLTPYLGYCLCTLPRVYACVGGLSVMGKRVGGKALGDWVTFNQGSELLSYWMKIS
jgi:hypothetical protein